MQRLEGGAITAAHPGGELGRLLVALDDGALNFPLVRGSGESRGQRRATRHTAQEQPHSTSTARISRTFRAKSSTACASATRSSTERMMVEVVSTCRPNERTPSAS